uniref:Uncharacterized protein n=1 Tax=Rhizophora mucronata TaxID=61149 RepID=A0A2P2KMK9_RHIMU
MSLGLMLFWSLKKLKLPPQKIDVLTIWDCVKQSALS